MSFVYDTAKEGILTGLFDLSSASYKVALVSGYDADPGDGTLADVIMYGGTILATADLANVTYVGGVIDANDVTFPSVATGATVGQVVVYQHTLADGTAAADNTERLLLFLYDDAANMPYATNDGDVIVSWSNTATRIYSL